MKRVSIINNAHIPGDTPEQPEMVCVGSVLDLDDDIAGQLVVAGKARYETKDAKLKNTAREVMAECDARAKTASLPPEAAMAAMVAAAIKDALTAKPAAATA
jgi:hypothetical protein